MSGSDTTRDDATFAAEYALGLLEGEELLNARGRMVNDSAFAASVAWWEGHFAPLTDEIAGAQPDAALWDRIAAEIAAVEAAPDTGAEVIDLTARLRRWQWTAALTSAAAAVMVALMIFGPGFAPGAPVPPADSPPQIASADALVASMPIGETPLRLGVTYLPDSEEMLVSASGLSADGVHDHELWLVTGGGEVVQSLGVIVAGEERRVSLPQDVSRNMTDGAQVLLTREPLGGKPADQDPGPVMAQGVLTKV